VVEAFAEHAPAVERLLCADVEFARLCEDFDAVVTAYRRASSGELPPGVADEYHSLRLELESEILEWVRCGSNPVGGAP
jgi:hypothetical protein